jgi:hypothetical protein
MENMEAALTFAIARHALVDLSIVLNMWPREPAQDRLTLGPAFLIRSSLRQAKRQAGLSRRGYLGAGAAGFLPLLSSMTQPYSVTSTFFLVSTLFTGTSTLVIR